MVDIKTVRKFALSLDEALELPYFHMTSFRIRKKVFATLDIKKNQIVLMLSEIDQSVFSGFDTTIMYPFPNSWGKRGATIVELKRVRKDIFKDALTAAYCKVAPKVLAEKYRPK
jgi:hypothetical protein